MKSAPPGILPLVSVDRNSPLPLYQQVYQGYRDAIVDRRLRAGQRLPSTRSLAAELQISRIPILNAFEQLLAEGYVEGRVGAGTFVARTLPDDAPLETDPYAGAGMAALSGTDWASASFASPGAASGDFGADRGTGAGANADADADAAVGVGADAGVGAGAGADADSGVATTAGSAAGGTRRRTAEAGAAAAAGAAGGASTMRPDRSGTTQAGMRRPPGARVVSMRPAVAREKRVEPWLGGWGPFRMNQPAVDLFPFDAWSKVLLRHARRPQPRLLRYDGPMGLRAFREAIAGYLRTARAVRCDADQIMVVSGSQQALEIAARVLLDPDSAVWMEEPGYVGARDALLNAGARLACVPVDAEGLDVARGIAGCPEARAVYVTPSHQYPLGMTMSATRRLQLLAWAQRAGAWIIEDDYDSEFRYGTQPVAALQGLDRDARVIYIGTFSKVLFPAIRIGYIVIPPDLVERFAAVREAMDICAPTLFQSVLAAFIEEGHFARHVRRMRQLYRERRGVLIAALAAKFGTDLRVLGDQAGMHLVAAFDERLHGRRDRDIAERAAATELWAMPLSTCYHATPRLQGLVLGYGGTSTDAIPDGVRRLRAVFDQAGAANPAR